jgi:hypothetical protein
MPPMREVAEVGIVSAFHVTLMAFGRVGILCETSTSLGRMVGTALSGGRL